MPSTMYRHVAKPIVCSITPVAPEGVQYKKNGGRVVVHHDRSLAAEQLSQRFVDVNVALPAFALFDIEFEVRVADRYLPQMLNRSIGQRAAPRSNAWRSTNRS